MPEKKVLTLEDLAERVKQLELSLVALFHCSTCGAIFHVQQASEPGPGATCPVCSRQDSANLKPATIQGGPEAREKDDA